MPLRGWIDVLRRVAGKIGQNRLGLTAAGLAFYAMLALFPALAAALALWGLFADPAVIVSQMESAGAMLPDEAADLLQDQVVAVAKAKDTSGFAFGLSTLLAIFSASRAAKALMQGLNIVYGENERRGLIRFNLVAAVITLCVSLWTLLMFAALVMLPIVLEFVGLGQLGERLVGIARWPILLVAAWLAVVGLFRYAPCREHARWRWVTPGAIFAVISWLIVSLLFSIYVENFASYNATYGAIGSVVALLMWLWLSAFVLLLGAEIDAELERQTEADTTVEPDMPMGERGAFVADAPSPARQSKQK